MNRYPTWLNLLVLGIVLLGSLLALPNIYGNAPAVQLGEVDGNPFDEAMIGRVVTVLEENAISPKESFLAGGRVIVTFNCDDDQQDSSSCENDQQRARDILRERFSDVANIAFSSEPELPPWIRSIGLNPMSLGLDLQGGVYVLLEVDMESAIESRLQTYSQDFFDSLRNERIRSRSEVIDQQVVVRLNAEDLEAARDVIREADSDVLILDGADGKSLRVRMSEMQNHTIV